MNYPRRALHLLLVTMAVAYAALACLRTVADFDSGWHLATGRYVIEHHVIPSTDVLSHTSAGEPWHYPPFAGALLYAVFHWFGYAGLSWFSAGAAALLAAYLLWRATPQQTSGRFAGDPASVAAGVLLVLAVPSLAYRLTPRAEHPSLAIASCDVALGESSSRVHRGARRRRRVCGRRSADVALP